MPQGSSFQFTCATVAAWAVVVLLGACSTNHFDGRSYRSGNIAFELREIPPGWRQLQAEGTLLSFRDDNQASTVAVNARCGKDADDVPLRSLTQHLFLQFTEKNITREQTLTLAGREALQTDLSAKLDGVLKHFVVVVLKKDGCVYDFLHVAGSKPSQQDHDTFQRFVQGFSTLE